MKLLETFKEWLVKLAEQTGWFLWGNTQAPAYRPVKISQQRKPVRTRYRDY